MWRVSQRRPADVADGGGNDHRKLWLRTELRCVQEQGQLHSLDGPEETDPTSTG